MYSRFYLLGKDVNFSELYPHIDFPVSRNTPTLSDLAGWNYTDKWELTNAEDERSANKVLKNLYVNLNSDKFEDLLGHEIKGNPVMPVGAYLVSCYPN